MAARNKARRRAMNVLFEAEQRELNPVTVLADRIVDPGREAALPPYAIEIVEGVCRNLRRIDELLDTYSHGWTLERMPAVDRALLRIGVWEIVFNDEVPPAVAVDEAINIAREMSTDDSPAFINGLLGRIVDLGDSVKD